MLSTEVRAQYPGISVVVPAYRSPDTLQRLVTEVELHVGPLTRQLEIVLVDDGSGDSTWPTICRLANEHSGVVGATLLRNYGQHNALLAGLRMSAQPIIVTIDDDLQNPPSEIPKLLAALTDDVDLVYGWPKEQQQGASRNVASRMTKGAMAFALGADVYPRISAFRAFRRVLVDASSAVVDPDISIDVLLAWGTRHITDVAVDHEPRASGSSGYSLRRLIRHALTMSTGYSTRPLRWVSVIGVLFALFGFVLLAFLLIRYAIGDSEVAGFTFLGAAITLFAGVQLLSLGVIGEYLGRIHFRSMGKPGYVVRTTTRAADQRS